MQWQNNGLLTKGTKMATYRDIETKVLIWGDARKITTNGTALGQASKTVEEACELLTACAKLSCLDPDSSEYAQVLAQAKDGIGDVLVTLVMVGAKLDVDVIDCFAGAYEEIKGRTGTLMPNGVFVKD